MKQQNAIMLLGSLAPDQDGVIAALAILEREMAPEELFVILSRSKVTRLALASIDTRGAGGAQGESAWAKELRRLLAAEVAEDDAWRAQAEPKMREVVEAAAERGGRIIKGLCVQSGYPKPDQRHLGDVDLQYPYWDAAVAMVRWLRARDWVYDITEYPWLKWDDNGSLYGQLSLVYPDNAAPYARVDLHIGPFSVGHAGLLPLAGWSDGAALGLPATVPSVETSIAIIAAHALCDQLLSIKDVNDLYVLLRSASPDWSSVYELCRAVGATGALAAILAAVRAAYPDDVDLLPPGNPPRIPLGLTPPDPEARAEAFAALAFRDELSRGADPVRAFELARGARAYFSGTVDLTPRSGAPEYGGLPADQRRRDVCWRLVPQEAWGSLPAAASGGPAGLGEAAGSGEPLGAELSLVTVGDAAAVRLGSDVLVPTVWGEISSESVTLAQRLAERTS